MTAGEAIAFLAVAWILGFGVGVKIKAVRQMVDAA